MNIVMTRNISTTRGPFKRDEIYDVPISFGIEWIRAGYAVATDREPPHVARLLARLEDGTGRACLFLPFIGEFGHLIMTHLRIVHFHKAATKIVCCRAGDESLYPSADMLVTDWTDPIPDERKVATIRYERYAWPDLAARFPGCHPIEAGRLAPDQELYAINPLQPIPFKLTAPRGLRADVVLGVRRREFCPERNWPHWQQLADSLAAAGHTFAVIGRRPTTEDLAGQVAHSGDHDTAAAIELLQNCRLYIGTDTGISHLASTVGAHMLLFRETAGGSRDMTERMRLVNCRARTEILPSCWDRPDIVAAQALAMLKGMGTT